MRNRQHERPRSFYAVHKAEGKLMKRISAKVREVNRPPFRRILYGVDRFPQSILEFHSRGEVPITIPSQRIQVIFFRTGMKLQRLDWHRLLPVQQRPPLPLDLAPWNSLDLARANLIHPTGNFLLPGDLSIFIHNLIQAVDQRTGEFSPSFERKGHGFL
jgi:hypothetical protein